MYFTVCTTLRKESFFCILGCCKVNKNDQECCSGSENWLVFFVFVLFCLLVAIGCSVFWTFVCNPNHFIIGRSRESRIFFNAFRSVRTRSSSRRHSRKKFSHRSSRGSKIRASQDPKDIQRPEVIQNADGTETILTYDEVQPYSAARSATVSEASLQSRVTVEAPSTSMGQPPYKEPEKDASCVVL